MYSQPKMRVIILVLLLVFMPGMLNITPQGMYENRDIDEPAADEYAVSLADENRQPLSVYHILNTDNDHTTQPELPDFPVDISEDDTIDNPADVPNEEVTEPPVMMSVLTFVPEPTATPKPTPKPTPVPTPKPSPAPAQESVNTNNTSDTSDEPESIAMTLARMIHIEAHNQPYNGKIAVGQCAYDRWKNSSRASGQPAAWNPGGSKSLYQILTAPGQFLLASSDKVCNNCLQAATDVLNGTKAFPDYIITNFRPYTSSDDWNNVPFVGRIEGHAFYGYKR